MIEIRPEHSGDIQAITVLTEAAFAPTLHSNGTEAQIIHALRQAGELALSLVAIENNKLLGQITFSPVTINGMYDGWYGLGPVSVHPDQQGRGIGSQLIHKGLAQIRSADAKGCVLVGNPAYYSRFGFVGNAGLTYVGLDPNYVQQLAFVGPLQNGELLYSPAFEAAAREGS